LAFYCVAGKHQAYYRMVKHISLEELEDFAESTIPSNIFKYFAHGAGDKATLKENVNAFKRWKVVPHYLQGADCLNIDTGTLILGEAISSPICAGPSGFHKLGHQLGELETAKGCYAAGTCMTVSAYSSYSYEDIANAVPQGLRWLQMYIFKDRNLTKDFVRRAETCGYKALVITIDTDPLTMKEGSRCALPIPEGAIAANFKDVCGSSDLLEPCLQWSDIKWLRSITKLPIVLKGIMSTFDARMAVKNGINGIIISNKGGRKLDVLPSTLDVLPEIADEVKNKMEIYIDGGIRRGSDVFKALALGARAVFLGRPVLWGLIHDGNRGVQNVFETMNEELRIIMANAGCRKISEINRSALACYPRCSCKL